MQNDYSLRNNEIDQIGFRLAKYLQHDKVWAIDWNDTYTHIPDLDDISSEKGKQQLHQIENNFKQQMQLVAEAMKNNNIIDNLKSLIPI